MRISVFGTGYVGLVTGVCFAEMGNDVICADVDKTKIEKLKLGESPIFEPGLDDLISNNQKAKRIQFTVDLRHAVAASETLFIAVGTPSDVDGSADLKYVLQVAQTIGREMTTDKIVVNKSTVPVGTAKRVKDVIQKELDIRGVKLNFDVVSNPEFLREGCAIEDALKPSRVVVGCETETAKDFMRRLYEPFLKSGNPLLVMDPLSSEMTKYAANAMLATKISLMNEFSRVCEKVGADIENVRRGIGSDPRIGPHFIFAGVGYGGSCFPKDVRALIHAGAAVDEKMEILQSVEHTNLLQRENFIKRIMHELKKEKSGPLRVAVWGVSFKPGTDDIREAPSLDLIAELIKASVEVSAFDPVAAAHTVAHFENSKNLKFCEDQYQTLEGAHALVIVTEWKSFREPNFEKMKSVMKAPRIFDGRNIYNSKDVKLAGFEYHSIGRPS
jgi:UDPglucose 6-dehydrogenase